MSRELFDGIVREHFTPRDRFAEHRVGVEAEFICMDLAGRRPAPPRRVAPGDDRPGTVDVVARVAEAEGWSGVEGPGLPVFRTRDGTTVSWEPGGQVEFASAPLDSLDALDRALAAVTGPVVDALGAHGIGLLARGLDPWTPVEEPKLWLDHPRYRRMARHYDRAGEDGRRMMRQTAAVHVNLDLGSAPIRRWRRANACVPATIAAFANSPRVEGRDGWRSERSRSWRRLDPTRTGCVAIGDDPATEYADFARGANAFLVGEEDAAAEPWGERDAMLGEDAWRTHLTTLFPEVRPRGYLEIRTVDAQAPELVAVAAAFLAGIVYGPAPIPEVAPPTRARLEDAGRRGILAAGMRDEVAAWWRCAEAGLDTLGPAFASKALRDRVRRFRESVSEAGRDPGSSSSEWVSSELTGSSFPN